MTDRYILIKYLGIYLLSAYFASLTYAKLFCFSTS